MEVVPTNKFKNSSWTDLPILLILVLFTCGWVYIGVYSFLTGSPERLLGPVDSYGHICGTARQPLVYDGASMLDKRYLFYMNEDPSTSKSVCVHSCPSHSINDLGEFYNWITDSGTDLCEPTIAGEIGSIVRNLDVEDFSQNRSSLSGLFSEHGPCPSLPIFGTAPILGRCIPYVIGYSAGTRRAIRKLTNDLHLLKKVVLDLYRFRHAVVLYVPLFVYGLVSLMTSAIGHFHEYGLWFSLVLGLLASYGFTGFLVWSLVCSHHYLKTAERNDILMGVDVGNHYTLLLMTVLCAPTTIGASVAYILNRDRVNRAFGLFKESRLYFSSLRFVELLPLIFTSLLLAFYYLIISVASCLVTSDRPTIDRVTAYLTFRYPLPWLNYLQLSYLIFSALWLPCFNLNYQRGVIGHLTAQFYFSRGEQRRRVPFKTTILYALKAFRHSGSFALLAYLDMFLAAPTRIFGHFVQRFLPHAALRGLSPQPRNAPTPEERDNRINRSLYQTVHWRYFLLYPSQAPLVLVGLEKYAYFKALKKCHMIYLSCPFPIDGLTATLRLIFWLAKLGPVCLGGMLALILMQHHEDAHLFAIPLVTSCLFSYYVASSALAPIESVLSTLLLCFSEDLRLAHASSTHPIYYTSPTFLEMMETISPHFGPVGYIEKPLAGRVEGGGN